MSRLKPLIFYEACWLFHVHILVPCTGKQFARYFNATTGSTTTDDDGSGQCAATVAHVVIGLDCWPTTAADFGILSHECLHAVHGVLPAKGLKFCADTEEAYAYLHGSLFERCLRLLNENRD